MLHPISSREATARQQFRQLVPRTLGLITIAEAARTPRDQRGPVLTNPLLTRPEVPGLLSPSRHLGPGARARREHRRLEALVVREAQTWLTEFAFPMTTDEFLRAHMAELEPLARITDQEIRKAAAALAELLEKVGARDPDLVGLFNGNKLDGAADALRRSVAALKDDPGTAFDGLEAAYLQLDTGRDLGSRMGDPS